MGRTVLAGIVATVLLVSTSPASAQQATSAATDDHVQLALDTAFGSPSTVDAVDGVVLATSGTFPDALAGAALADRDDARLLFTGPSRLDPRVRDALTRLVDGKRDRGTLRFGEVTVWLLGGPHAISDRVAEELESLDEDLRIVRLAGPTRSHTALRVAEEALDLYDREPCGDADGYTPPDGREEPWWQYPPEPTCGHERWRDMQARGEDGAPTIRLNRYWPTAEEVPDAVGVAVVRGWGRPGAVNGPTAWADAMTVASHLAPDATRDRATVLVLSPTASLEPHVARWLREQPVGSAMIVGGPDALASVVSDQVTAAVGRPAVRVAGQTRADTAVALWEHFTGQRPDVHVGVDARDGTTLVSLANGWDARSWGLALTSVNTQVPVLWAGPDGMNDALDGVVDGCHPQSPLRPFRVLGLHSLSTEQVVEALQGRTPAACYASMWSADGPHRYPSCMPLEIFVNPEGLPHGTRAALVRAVGEFNRWSAGLTLRVAGDTDLRASDAYGTGLEEQIIQEHGASSVVVSNPPRWDDRAYARGGSVSDAGLLVAGSVQVQGGLSHDDDELADLLLHEMGHVVGLGHVPEGTGQVMSQWDPAGWTGLQDGDVDGVRWTTAGPCRQ